MTYIPSTFRCNGCSVERTQSNGWYELHVDAGTAVVPASLLVQPFTGSQAAEHYCGAGCLLPAISCKLRLLHPQPAPLATVEYEEPKWEPAPEPVPAVEDTDGIPF